MDVVQKLNAVVKELKVLGAINISSNYSGTVVQLMENDLKELGLELKIRRRDYATEFPYKVFAEVDGVTFYAVLTKEEVEEHFSHLVEEDEPNELEE